ncbi:MAG: GNAT family N-acetyltransferase [Bacteroidales bacterium]|nr:GNAT family N-acetyltransferase [Bacteroidales bacterium]MDD4210569.1 GNAT family N-acetyltransferase [Bacteroidales bacterium]
MHLLIVNDSISLHQISKEDAEDIFNAIDSQRDYLRKWLPFVETTNTIKDTLAFINDCIAKNEIVFVIRYKHAFAGLIGFKDADNQNKKIEIGYWLSENFQHRGLITSSLKKLTTFAFEHLKMNRIQIKCAVNNLASKRIPQTNGFQFEGIERDGELLSDGHFTDLEVYSLLRKDVL